MLRALTQLLRRSVRWFDAATGTTPYWGGNFDGATNSRRGFGIGRFGPINSEIAVANYNVRQRARYLAANNPWTSQAVANWVGALVGSGIVPTGKNPDDTTRAAQATAFATWADDSDADGRTDFGGQQADVARAMVVDGECFVHLLTTPVGPRLRLIPAELVDESLTRDIEGGAFIIQGIEFSASCERVAYHVLPYRPTDVLYTYGAPVRVPAEDILHVFKPLAAGQVRGISWLAPIILSASDFDQLVDALTMGAKVAAMMAGFLKDVNGTSSASGTFDGDACGSILESGLEPGTLKVLPSGVDISFSTPAQVTQVQPLVRLQLLQLAAGLGLPDHLVSGDLTGANYSSLRAGLLPFRQRVEQIQYGVLVPQLLRPTWRRVLNVATLTGALEYDSNMAVDWIMPAFLQVDPLKAVQAETAEIAAGLTSRRKAVAARGWSIDDLDAEIAADNARAKALGLTFVDPPATQPTESNDAAA